MNDIEMDMAFMSELDELSAIECDVIEECAEEAAWVAQMACCPEVILHCEVHHEALMQLIELKAITRCGECGTVGSFNLITRSIERL